MSISPQSLGLPPKFTSYRPEVNQEETIISLAASDHRISILCAPPGTGKSPIAISLAKLLDARYLYLVSTKNLGLQIYNDFSSIGLTNISGHGTYSCNSRGRGGDRPILQSQSSNLDQMVDIDCTRPRDCPYRADVDYIRERKLPTTTNYAHWITLGKSQDPNRLGKYDLLICDEAHLIDPIICDQLAVKLSDYSIKMLLGIIMPNSDESIETWQEWAQEACSIAKYRLERANTQDHNNHNLSSSDTSKALHRLKEDLARFITDSRSMEWIAESQIKGISLKPVWNKHYVERYLFRGIDRILLMSGTISPITAEYLSLNKSDYDWIEVSSAYPSSRRPFIFLPTRINNQLPPINVDYRTTDGEMKFIASTFDNFISNRLDRKGIVQAVSYRLAKSLSGLSKHKSIIITHESGSENVRQAVSYYKRSKPPAILISPAIKEGYDFPDDECRYVILPKIPRPDGREPLIAARTKTSKRYKYFLAANSIIQSALRGMRSMNDWCEIVMLDGHWQWFQNEKDLFPAWFRSAWTGSYNQPKPLTMK